MKVLNSSGPDTIDADVLSTGARAVLKEDAVADVDVMILSIPFIAIPALAPLLASIYGETVMIDTSNSIPAREERVEAVENGQADSVWVAERLGRPIAKAWNSIYSGAFKGMGKPAGHSERIAAPVAAERDRDREVTMALVEAPGFDAYDAGALENSWRQQTSSPCYRREVKLADLS